MTEPPAGEGLPPPGEAPPPIGEGLPPAEARPHPAVLRRVRAGARAAALLTAAGVLLLVVFTPLPWVEVLALPAFLLLLPGLAVAQLPLLDSERLERIPVYVGSIVTILVMGLVAALLGLRLDGVAPAGLHMLPAGALLFWTVGLTVGGLLVIAVFHPVDRRIGGGRPELLSELLPRTPRERGVFAGLSVSAGVGEELAYRGYAYQAIQLLGPGPWFALFLASIPFGFLHAYQGPVGIARTAAMGFVLGLPVVLTGSLIPSMAAHALLDIILGLVIGPRLYAGGESERAAPSGGSDARPLVPPDPDE